jgi:hypothetical protein
MPIMFNTILHQVGLNPSEVRLVRHKHNEAIKGRRPYELWRDDRQKFELYQSIQPIRKRRNFAAPHWAVFVVNYAGETMFAGLYGAQYSGLLQEDTPRPHSDGYDKAGQVDVYDLKLQDKLVDLRGRLFIDWGPAALAWVQYAERHDKPVTELRVAFQEPDFPGFLNFVESLSRLTNLPSAWIATLRSCRGIYLLTCPRTKEQYVGSATGNDGFWGRWQAYIGSGDGGNIGLKSRDSSDYQVSILEVAGSAASPDDILAMEGRWQRKLMSREMGLNRNRAG